MANSSSVEIVVHLKNDTSSDHSSDVNIQLQDLDMQEDEPISEKSCKMRKIEVSDVAICTYVCSTPAL